MLSPDYLLRVSEGGEAIAETLHTEIIKKMVERISARLDRGDNYILTAYDKWQIEVLQDAGFLREDIEKELAKRTGIMQSEIAEAMVDAGVRSDEKDAEIYRAAGISPDPLEQSPYLTRLMQRNYEATMGEWINFTRTTADACQTAFIGACDTAYTMVASGAVGYGEAFRDAINSIIDHGATVTYPSGHTDTIETATLRCIRTGISQATAQITDARMEEMDWDIILVSSHLGARVTDRNDYTNHYWWQGKFYSKSGKDTRFPPYSVCGEGNVQGIHGANCRHSHGPGDGEFNPYDQYDSEENLKEYELQQRQRLMERRIRESKRKCIGLQQGIDSATTDEAKALLQKDYEKASATLQNRNAAYNQFCEDNDLKKLNERITIAQWDRKQAAQARAAAKKSNKTKPSGEKAQVQKAMVEKQEPQRNPVNGKDLVGDIDYSNSKFEYDIETALNAQGFDGLPMVVSNEEFEEALKKSNFYAERTYCAPTQEVLDEYRNQLYNGKWYVDCSEGGAQYGQGMYCAARFEKGKYIIPNDNKIGKEMSNYQEIGISKGNKFSYTEGITLTPDAKIFTLYEDDTDIINRYAREYALKKASSEDMRSVIREMIDIQEKIDRSSNSNFVGKVDWDFVDKLYDERARIYDTNKYKDEINKLINEGFSKAKANPGALAAEMGYDAINAQGHGESGSYTVILNRTKCIFREGGSMYGN